MTEQQNTHGQLALSSREGIRPQRTFHEIRAVREYADA